MIVKMTRYDFLLYHRDAPKFLESLRELGLVDITLRDFEPTDSQREKLERSKNYTRIAKAMKSIKAEGEAYSSVEKAVEMFESATSEITSINDKITALKAEAKRVEAWGDFDATQIEVLRQEGVMLRFFEVPAKNFKSEWADVYPIEVINTVNSVCYFVVAVSAAEAIDSLDITAIELAAPVRSAAKIEEEIEQLTAKSVELQAVRARAANSREEILSAILSLTEDVDYMSVLSSAESEAEGTLLVLEGWSETSREADIVKFADSQDVYYTMEAANEAQNPPIKLKNKFFPRLFEPIGAIYIYPRYNELDLTPFFAPFFMIFFGMCLGDAGYGMLLILAVALFWKKIPKAYKDFGWLIIFLNLAAVVFGIFSGNTFGIALAEVPALVEFKEMFLTPNDVFYLSILLGGVQVVFGLFLRTFNRIRRGGKFIYGVSNIGWLLLILGSILAFTGVLPGVYDLDSVAYTVTLYVALACILFFTVPYKPLKSIGGGLYSFYEMGTGIIGDLISYVRLFAIGLAGTIIAQVFNELSVGLSGDIPVVSFIIMVVILLIGHGLNIFISILGAIVHPIRLTFVEFYKNAEFEGGGRLFTPFRRKIIKK